MILKELQISLVLSSSLWLGAGLGKGNSFIFKTSILCLIFGNMKELNIYLRRDMKPFVGLLSFSDKSNPHYHSWASGPARSSHRNEELLPNV